MLWIHYVHMQVLVNLEILNSTGKCNRLGSWHRKGQLVYFPSPFQTPLPTEALMGTYHQLTEYQRYQICRWNNMTPMLAWRDNVPFATLRHPQRTYSLPKKNEQHPQSEKL